MNTVFLLIRYTRIIYLAVHEVDKGRFKDIAQVSVRWGKVEILLNLHPPVTKLTRENSSARQYADTENFPVDKS